MLKVLFSAFFVTLLIVEDVTELQLSSLCNLYSMKKFIAYITFEVCDDNI